MDNDTDYIRILRPRSVWRMLLDLVGLRNERVKSELRGATITEVVQALRDSDRDGQVVSLAPDGDQWSVTLRPGLKTRRVAR